MSLVIVPQDITDYLGEQVDFDRALLFCELIDGLLSEPFGGVLPNPVPTVFRTVALAVVSRVLTNPRGLISETVGGYSYNLNRNDTPSGLALTLDERRTLRRAVGLPVVRSVSLSPTQMHG